MSTEIHLETRTFLPRSKNGVTAERVLASERLGLMSVGVHKLKSMLCVPQSRRARLPGRSGSLVKFISPNPRDTESAHDSSAPWHLLLSFEVKLPNGDRAIIDSRKLEEYCLNPQHPRGRNKARVFASVGISLADSEALRQALLAAARDVDARRATASPWGQRYIIDFDLNHGARSARIRSTWIVRTREGLPRLTSCYVL